MDGLLKNLVIWRRSEALESILLGKSGVGSRQHSDTKMLHTSDSYVFVRPSDDDAVDDDSRRNGFGGALSSQQGMHCYGISQ